MSLALFGIRLFTLICIFTRLCTHLYGLKCKFISCAYQTLKNVYVTNLYWVFRFLFPYIFFCLFLFLFFLCFSPCFSFSSVLTIACFIVISSLFTFPEAILFHYKSSRYCVCMCLSFISYTQKRTNYVRQTMYVYDVIVKQILNLAELCEAVRCHLLQTFASRVALDFSIYFATALRLKIVVSIIEYLNMHVYALTHIQVHQYGCVRIPLQIIFFFC